MALKTSKVIICDRDLVRRLFGKEYAPNSIFNLVPDKEGNTVLHEWQVEKIENEEFLDLKDNEKYPLVEHEGIYVNLTTEEEWEEHDKEVYEKRIQDIEKKKEERDTKGEIEIKGK